MERTRKAGNKLNFEKCVVKTNHCEFFGNIYTPDGMKPDPNKVWAIKEMSSPKDKKSLQSFLSMVTYLSPYLEQISDHTAPLRELIRKDAHYVWTDEHTKAFNTIKDLISKDVTLAYYDPRRSCIRDIC